MGPVIDLRDVTVSYGRHPAVHHLSGVFSAGSLTAVVGPNGAGKTTLLKAIVGLLPVDAGGITTNGLSAHAIAYLPQHAAIDRSFPITTLDAVLLGHYRKVGPFGRIARDLIEQGRQALSSVGLVGFDDRPIGTLSTGQLQRALFARVILQDAPVILLDEPFGPVDARTTADLFELMERWHGESRTIIAVLHDLTQVADVFPEALYLARECVAWGPTASVLTAENHQRAHTMAEAWRNDADICVRAVA
ncbi:MAG: ABC transporter ATP-binding protein [Alphaproteobacteria bacterium]|nr:ABC transporter ATP-binding protein [Alphaproteobacteria bacterium]